MRSQKYVANQDFRASRSDGRSAAKRDAAPTDRPPQGADVKTKPFDCVILCRPVEACTLQGAGEDAHTPSQEDRGFGSRADKTSTAARPGLASWQPPSWHRAHSMPCGLHPMGVADLLHQFIMLNQSRSHIAPGSGGAFRGPARRGGRGAIGARRCPDPSWRGPCILTGIGFRAGDTEQVAAEWEKLQVKPPRLGQIAVAIGVQEGDRTSRGIRLATTRNYALPSTRGRMGKRQAVITRKDRQGRFAAAGR